MKECKACQTQLPDESVFCFRCGTRVGGSRELRDTTGRRSFWPERFGPAIIEGEIGKGGMAVVFRARHEQLGLPVAVKAMSTSSPIGDVERFRREARVGMRLSSPGCVKVYDFGEVDPFFYMIQEFVEGEDLRERIRRRQRFPWWEALTLTLEIARILDYIHGQGIIHRDIKPANIFLPWRGGVKVGDFGLATEGHGFEVQDERLTMAGLAIGSPAYMPPEQFRDTSSVDERGDLYALGITMFELLAGEPPFRSKKVSALRDMHLNEDRPRPSDRVAGLPPSIEAIVLKLIERDPLDRYQKAEQVVADLRRLVIELQVEDMVEEERSNTRKTTRSLQTIAPLEVQETNSGERLPPGYDLLHPLESGPGWKCLLVHHVESGQDLNLFILERKAVDDAVADRIKADLLRIGAANVRGFNGAIAVGDIEDTIFAASFRNEGRSYKDFLEEEGTLEEEVAVGMVQDLALALRPLHEAGVTVRGLRPERLFRDTTTGKTTVDVVATILCDEGLAPLSALESPDALAYLAPERLDRGQPEGGVAGDIFAIGAILHRLMTGAAIHADTGVRDFASALREKRPMSLREILGGRCTRVVSDAVRKCLETEPTQRFANIEALSLALKGRKAPSPSGRYVRKPPARLTSFIGLDFGAASARIARIEKDGRARMVLHEDGQSLVPTCVHLGANGRAQIGEAALLAARKDPGGLHRGFARDLLDIEGDEHPIILSALVTQHLLKRGEAALGQVPQAAVLAVPTMLGERERYGLRIAAEIAGLKVLGTIPDTTAAALAYGLSPQSKPTRALVLDLGASGTSVAILEIRGGNLQVLAADGLRSFGGEQWSERLRRSVAQKHIERTGLDPLKDPLARLFLDEQIENAKRILSTRTKVRILVAAGGKVERYEVSRAMLEDNSRDLLQRLASVLEGVLEKSNLGWNSVDRVLAVGGGARMPAVTKLLWKVTGRVPDAILDHNHAVAEGAAYYALKLKAQRGDVFAGKPARLARKIVIRNVATFSLGVVLEAGGGQTLSHTIIPEQSPLPAKVTKIFALQPDARGRVRIRLVEGDPRAGAMRTVGICTIHEVESLTGEAARIATTYALSEDGRLHVEAHETRTGKPYTVKIDRLIAGLDKIKASVGRARQSSGPRPRPKL